MSLKKGLIKKINLGCLINPDRYRLRPSSGLSGSINRAPPATCEKRQPAARLRGQRVGVSERNRHVIIPGTRGPGPGVRRAFPKPNSGARLRKLPNPADPLFAQRKFFIYLGLGSAMRWPIAGAGSGGAERSNFGIGIGWTSPTVNLYISLRTINLEPFSPRMCILRLRSGKPGIVRLARCRFARP